jgi:peptidoglycan-associated lipoprotein
MTRLTTGLLLVAALGLSACQGGFRAGERNGAFDASRTGTGMDASDPTSVAYFNQTIGDRVLFEIDQSTLTDTARATLDGQARWLIQNTAYSALVEGHADEQGTREYNLALGARRASAVRDYLVSKGIADSRLRTVSYGKERPLEICSAEACYAKNRRAVTVISAGPTS